MRVEALKKTIGGDVGSADGNQASTRAIWRARRRRARCSSKREIGFSPGTARSLTVHPPELTQRRHFTVVDALDAVPPRQLGDADVLDEPFESARLDGGRLVAAPQGAVEGDVSL